MRVRNLYDPVNLRDYPTIPEPYCQNGTTCTYEVTDDGWKIHAVNSQHGGIYDAWGWIPSSAAEGVKVAFIETKAGDVRQCESNFSFRIEIGEPMVFTRICGYEDASSFTMLQSAGLPLVFAATDHPY